MVVTALIRARPETISTTLTYNCIAVIKHVNSTEAPASATRNFVNYQFRNYFRTDICNYLYYLSTIPTPRHNQLIDLLNQSFASTCLRLVNKFPFHRRPTSSCSPAFGFLAGISQASVTIFFVLLSVLVTD